VVVAACGSMVMASGGVVAVCGDGCSRGVGSWLSGL
jgi:hypothetical protein